MHIEGILTVHTIADWHLRLAASARLGEPAILDASEVVEADTIGVQLLLSVRKSAAAAGAPFAITAPSAPLVRACASAAVSLETDLSPLQ